MLQTVILVDNSIWLDHLRMSDPDLSRLLEAEQVLSHPLVIGEIAMGRWKQRTTALRSLHRLPQAAIALDSLDSEVLHLTETRELSGIDIGYISTSACLNAVDSRRVVLDA